MNSPLKRISPSRPDQKLPDVLFASPKEITRAARDARRAWTDWRTIAMTQRAEILENLAGLLKKHSDVFARAITLEVGKPIRYAAAEIERSAALLMNVSSYATAPIEKVCEPHAVVRYVPVGVIALITPWNNPIAIPIGKIAPALLYGNTVVWKPSPAATSVAHRLFELLTRAGCPEGVLNIVSGDASTAEILMKEESIEAVTLSGSLLAGRAAYYTCTNRLIPYQGELGGNNASIVWPDCDLKNAAELITEGAFGFSGQRCTANRRVIVHADCYDEFIELASATVQQMQAGDPFLIETQIGPLISTESRKRVAGVVDGAAQKGFLQLQPGVLKMGEYDTEAFHDPVIVCCDKPLDEVVQDETFGPLMVIQKTDSWENAIELCNGVKQGLAASVFSESAEIQEHFLQDARAGILKINRATSDAGVNVPFGGWKHSGVGPPEHGPSNREFYTRTQSIYR